MAISVQTFNTKFAEQHGGRFEVSATGYRGLVSWLKANGFEKKKYNTKDCYMPTAVYNRLKQIIIDTRRVSFAKRCESMLMRAMTISNVPDQCAEWLQFQMCLMLPENCEAIPPTSYSSGGITFVNHSTKAVTDEDPRPLRWPWEIRYVTSTDQEYNIDSTTARRFYINHSTKATTWDSPLDELDVDDMPEINPKAVDEYRYSRN